MKEKQNTIRELNEDELERAAAGDGKEDAESEEAWLRDTYCHGQYENGEHQFVRTGNHREDPFFIFWSKGYDEYQCAKCGHIIWIRT